MKSRNTTSHTLLSEAFKYDNLLRLTNPNGEKQENENMKKACTRCKAVKPLADFAKNATRPDGHQSWSRPCLKGWRVIRLAAQEAGAQPAADAPWTAWVSWANGNLKVASAARKAAVKTA